MRPLTDKQALFLDFLRSYHAEHAVWPSYRAITHEFGFRSPNSINQNLKALVKKGHLRYTPGEGYTFAQPTRTRGIPIRGVVAAGPLQEAVEADLGAVTLEMLFPNMDRLFALRVAGQSMQGAGIDDGDYVILIDDDIPYGGIGAVLYDGETSLKRIYYDERGLRLEPANPDYDAIVLEPDIFEEVRIIGRYVGHVTRTGIYRHPSATTLARVA